jgi:hypothetical protein
MGKVCMTLVTHGICEIWTYEGNWVETDDSKFLDNINLLSSYFIQLRESYFIICNMRSAPNDSEQFK